MLCAMRLVGLSQKNLNKFVYLERTYSLIEGLLLEVVLYIAVISTSIVPPTTLILFEMIP